MPHYPSEIEYSDKYQDDSYEYRHVILPKEVYKKLPRSRLLSESEWRGLGVQQSRGWVHYEIHKPEPHILLFRRPRGTDPVTGLPPAGFMPPAEPTYV
jgi:cyclin-dependent kinase regulatory subunit CKS1